MKNKKPLVIALVVAVIVGSFSAWYIREHKYEFRAETESNLFTLAQISASKGDHKKAVKFYEKLLSKDPKHTVAMRMLADSYIKLKQQDRAFEVLDKVIDLDPSEQSYENAISVSLQANDREREKKYRERLAEKKKPIKK